MGGLYIYIEREGEVMRCCGRRFSLGDGGFAHSVE
jgi:hypothetical protein